MGTTGLITHDDCLRHDTGKGHPERASRLTAVLQRLKESGVGGELCRVDAGEVSNEELCAVHPRDHVEEVARVCAAGPSRIDRTDTAVGPASYRAALLAAGGVVEAARRVQDGTWRNAFVAVRPPGHHAEANEAMGFCLFNSVAVAARALLAGGDERVAILDWDVHHGNGTQHIFEGDERVFYASLHQWPLYPGTGAAVERGVGAGEGTTRNCPMSPGSGDAEWLRALESVVLADFESFAPDAILISAGFDAHKLDPLAQCNLSTSAYGAMTRLIADFAAKHCNGRIVSVLEGGYDLDALADASLAHVEALREAAS